MSINFSLLDKIVDVKKFKYEEAAQIAITEKWRSQFGLGFSYEKWNEVFYVMVHGPHLTEDEFKKEGHKERLFQPLNENRLTEQDIQNKDFILKLQRSLANTDIKKILTLTNDVSSGLLILGVALRYVEGVEKYNKILTNNWIPQFNKIFNKRNRKNKKIYYYFKDLKENNKHLTYYDLEVLNDQEWFDFHR